MAVPRILINEDSEADLLGLLEEFSRSHFNCELRHVMDRGGFRLALEQFKPDLVISDYFLGDFNGMEVLDLVKEQRPGTPVIILTNALNEEIAVECMKRGASDYVLKSRLPSIVPAATSLLERRQVVAALQESEERFRAMADSAPVLMWVADPQLHFTYFNRPWLEFTGRPLEEQLGTGWTTGVHPEDLVRCREVLESCKESHLPFRMLFRMRRGTSGYRWILDYGVPRFDAEGVFFGYIGSCIDITEQHEAEAALTRRAVNQTALVNFSSFALARHPFFTLLSGAVRTVADTLGIEIALVLAHDVDNGSLNIAASSDLASDPTEQISRWCDASEAMFHGRMLLLPEDAESFPGAATLARKGVRSALAVVIGSGEKPYGVLLAASLRHTELTGDAASFLQSIANILSTVHARTLAEEALAASEQKLLQSQKMEAVGLLAGGVAHDFNNLLTAIRCYAEILHDDLAELAPSAQPKTSEILKATARASALTRQLLAFSRKQVVQPEILDLNQVLGDISDILRSLLSENIVFDQQLHQETMNIRADRGQVEQVIINLAINARDAMPQGGRLTMRTSRRLFAPSDEDIRDLAPGSYIEFFVTDTGVGMSPEVQAHLFEPFFTTKPKGRGTGLGLATCSVILKNTGGSIRCSSRLGEGTTFTVLLPEEAEIGDYLEKSEDETPLGHSERILLVEDDEAVRTVTQSILKALGYVVHAEPGGPEALAYVLGDSTPHFDLLFTDIVMPYIGGHELAERVTALRPGVRVLFMSGYVDDPAVLQAMQDSQAPFLEKPFNRQTLAKKLREALEGR